MVAAFWVAVEQVINEQNLDDPTEPTHEDEDLLLEMLDEASGRTRPPAAAKLEKVEGTKAKAKKTRRPRRALSAAERKRDQIDRLHEYLEGNWFTAEWIRLSLCPFIPHTYS